MNLATIGLFCGERPDFPGAERQRQSPVDGSNLSVWTEPKPNACDPLINQLTELDLRAEADLQSRSAALLYLASELERDAGLLAGLVTMENGCPTAQSEALQVHSAVALIRSLVDQAERFAFTEERPGARGGTVRIERMPIGVALGIIPSNVPIFLACLKLSTALLAGCPVVLKPSPENADSMAQFSEHLGGMDLPAGAVNLILGGRALGDHLVHNSVFRKVSFTGSSASGRAVARVCAERFARLTLELGGKSSAILLEDVDFEHVKEQLWLAMLQNNGQVCGAQSRVLVPKSRAAELRSKLRLMFEETIVGDPRSSDTEIGPVVSAAAASRIRSTCMTSLAQGAVLVNDLVGECEESPTVFPRLYDVQSARPEIWNEELFGPVACMRVYETEDQAIAWANQSTYGLSGSVWSSDTDRALQVAHKLNTGTVSVNSKKILDFAAPFGGWGHSGIGRELGEDGFHSYLEAKTILLP